MNFGMYGSPERSLVFDVNDFDETLPGPFEWDVKRLVASLVVASRENGLSPKKHVPSRSPAHVPTACSCAGSPRRTR